MITAIWSIIIGVITGLAVWFDFRVFQKIFRALLISLSGLLLIGFITEPKWWPSDSGRYALITDGFEGENFNPNRYSELYSLRDKDQYKSGRKWLSSVSMITDEISPGSRIDLFGFGVKEELPKNYRWFDQLQNPGKGLILNHAPKQVDVGKRFEFSIRVQGTGVEDSIQVHKDGILWESQKMGSDSIIIFTDQLNMQGPITYDFEWMNNDSLYTESLNVRAVQPQLLTFGFLMYSPSFEVNYLTEHFGERGHSIINRSRIGQGRFRFDVMNADLDQAESFLENLSSLDILILDSREYQELSASGKDQVKEAVQDGLDILLTSPRVENAGQWVEVYSEIAGESINLQPINRLEERNWLPESIQESDDLTAPLSLLNLNFIDIPETAQTIHQYAGNETVSVKLQRGAGSITGQLFYQTYSWLLEGDKEAYNHFWVDYLSRVITLESSQIEVVPAIPRINEKVMITVAQPQVLERIIVKPVFMADSLSIPVTQYPANPDVVTASYWPKKTGWHFVEYEGQKNWFYVYGEDWKFDGSVQKYDYSKKQIPKTNSADTSLVGSPNTNVPNWIWAIGFMLIQFVLWFERKVA